MKRTITPRQLAAAILALAACWLISTSQGAEAARPPFFPFCIDWHDAKKRSYAEQAVMLKELGYDGVGHVYLDGLDERLKSLDAAGLKLCQIVLPVDLRPGQDPCDSRFQEALRRVKGRGVLFCLLVNGRKPSDVSVDDQAVKILREMSSLAAETDARLLLYPHEGSWIERIEDATRVAAKVARPNVGVSFNLCHWLRVDRNRDYKPLLEQALPRLWAVSINGADAFDPKPGWERYIQPLDSGNFDLRPFLDALDQIGYHGPIALQCYGIGGDARDHLARSMKAWKTLKPIRKTD